MFFLPLLRNALDFSLDFNTMQHTCVTRGKCLAVFEAFPSALESTASLPSAANESGANSICAAALACAKKLPRQL